MSSVETSKDLVKVGNLLNIVFGAIAIVILIITIIGIILTPLYAWLIWWTNNKVKKFNELVENGQYEEAKNELIIPSVLDMIFIGIIPGLFILIGALLLPSSVEQKTEQ